MIFGAQRPGAGMDLEAIEMAVRGAMHRAGAAALSQLLADKAEPSARVECGCGRAASYHDTRPKRLLTALGPLEIERAYYHCSRCQKGQLPRDTASWTWKVRSVRQGCAA